MLREEIIRLREILNTLIAHNAEYNEILKISRELDKLIIQAMYQSNADSNTPIDLKE